MLEQKYAEYIAEDIQVKKDGHVMMTIDVAKELNRKSHLEAENLKLKKALSEAGRYLDSFIETEGSKDHYIESTGEYENCQIDFSEAQKALDILGCDDDHGVDTSF